MTEGEKSRTSRCRRVAQSRFQPCPGRVYLFGSAADFSLNRTICADWGRSTISQPSVIRLDSLVPIYALGD
jgi:hypothetical protein